MRPTAPQEGSAQRQRLEPNLQPAAINPGATPSPPAQEEASFAATESSNRMDGPAPTIERLIALDIGSRADRNRRRCVQAICTRGAT